MANFLSSHLNPYLAGNNREYMLKCILVIDDDGVTRQLYSMTLTGMNVADKIGTFSYGAHALEFINVYIPEIIFVDLNMPGMNGFEVIEELNKNPNREKIKIVVMTSHYRMDEEKKLKALGIYECILKPLTEEKILKLIGNPVKS